MLTTIFSFLFLLVQKGAASFTSIPPSKTFYTPPDSVALRWTFDPSFNPVTITFAKFDPANNVYDDLVNYIIPIKMLTVFLPKDQPRMDLYGQATLRINDTTAADAGKYRCRLTSNTALESVAELAIRGTTSNAHQSTPVLENSPSAMRLRISSKLSYFSSERIYTASEAFKNTAASEQRLTPSDERLTSSEQRLTSSDQRLTPSDQRLTPSEQRLTSSEQRLTSSDQRLTSSDERLTSSNQRLTSSDQRLTSSDERLTSSNQRLTPSEQRLTSSEQRITSSEQRLTSSEQRLTPSNQRLTSSDQRLASSEQRLTSSDQRLTSRTRKVTENSSTKRNEITRIVAETTESYKVLENPTSSLQQTFQETLSMKSSRTPSEHGKSTSVIISLQFRLNSPTTTQSSQTLAVVTVGSSLEMTTQSTSEVSFQHPKSVSFAITQTLTTKVSSDVVIKSNTSNFPVNPTTHLQTEETSFSSTIPFLKTSPKSAISSHVISNRTSFIAVSHSGSNYQYEASSFEASKLVLITRFLETICNNTSPVYISTASQSRSHHGHEAASYTANFQQASTMMVFSYTGNTWTNSLRQATTATTTISNKRNTNSTVERRSRERDRTILAMALGIPFFVLLSCGGITLIFRTSRRRKTKYLTQDERCENRNDKSLEKSTVIINLKSIKMTNSSYDLHSK